MEKLSDLKLSEQQGWILANILKGTNGSMDIDPELFHRQVDNIRYKLEELFGMGIYNDGV